MKKIQKIQEMFETKKVRFVTSKRKALRALVQQQCGWTNDLGIMEGQLYIERAECLLGNVIFGQKVTVSRYENGTLEYEENYTDWPQFNVNEGFIILKTFISWVSTSEAECEEVEKEELIIYIP